MSPWSRESWELVFHDSQRSHCIGPLASWEDVKGRRSALFSVFATFSAARSITSSSDSFLPIPLCASLLQFKGHRGISVPENETGSYPMNIVPSISPLIDVIKTTKFFWHSGLFRLRNDASAVFAVLFWRFLIESMGRSPASARDPRY